MDWIESEMDEDASEIVCDYLTWEGLVGSPDAEECAVHAGDYL